MKTFNLNKKQIEETADKVSALLNEGRVSEATTMLSPIISNKVSFSQLDKIVFHIGERQIWQRNIISSFIDELVKADAMGSYVIAGSLLIPFIKTNLDFAIKKAQELIIRGNVWYVCDCVSERTLGNSLVVEFDKTSGYLKQFINEKNNWIVRSVGVAIHFYNKRVKDNEINSLSLLDLILPIIEVKNRDVIKGIGWGIKTTGKYHADLELCQLWVLILRLPKYTNIG